MFDSLDEQIKLDEHKGTSNRERVGRWILMALVAVVVFVGIYFGIQTMKGS